MDLTGENYIDHPPELMLDARGRESSKLTWDDDVKKEMNLLKLTENVALDRME